MERVIKAFNLDFNHARNQFARPGDFAHAEAQAHFDFYRNLGCNTIQTFAVNCSGYSFFRGTVAPVQPGMSGDFLNELCELGQRAGMTVMGYFCAAGNRYWGQTHPDEVRPLKWEGSPGIPFTPEYIDYFAESVADAMKKTDIDGFMLDWLFNGHGPRERRFPWLDCEIHMYERLLKRKFPGSKQVSAEDEQIMDTLATQQMFTRIRAAADSAGSKRLVWLTSPSLNYRPLLDSGVYNGVDWIMNESSDASELATPLPAEARKIQCLCGWVSHEADRILAEVGDSPASGLGFYGFAAADLQTTLLKTAPNINEECALESIRRNACNVDIIRDLYHRMP
ncbi:MAG: hypothetical protein WCT05_08220 [Lentisphaeria bacterium]